MVTDDTHDADQEQEKHQVECRRCGCRHFRVSYTRPRPRGIFRRRICRHCGAPLITWERPR